MIQKTSSYVHKSVPIDIPVCLDMLITPSAESSRRSEKSNKQTEWLLQSVGSIYNYNIQFILVT